MLVVWVSSMGAEILLRIEPVCPWPRDRGPLRCAALLLRCGAASLRSSDGFARRVVKARARDIFGDSLVVCNRFAGGEELGTAELVVDPSNAGYDITC